MNDILKIQRIKWNYIINKIIHIYFYYFKKLFKKEIYEISLLKELHNLVLRVLKKSDTGILGQIGADLLVTINELYFVIKTPRIYYDLLRFGRYEPATSLIIENVLKFGGVFVDVGANIGFYTLLSSKIVGEKGMVIAFEPDPNNYNYLKNNLKLNNIKNVHLINKCVGNQNGPIQLYQHPKYHSCQSIFGDSSRRSIQVDSTTLNNQFKDFKQNIDLIKMDIEGAEMEALEGMDRIFKKNNPRFLLIECNLRRLKLMGRNIRDFIERLGKYYQNFYLIKDDKDFNWRFFSSKIKLIEYLESLSNKNLDLLCFKLKTF